MLLEQDDEWAVAERRYFSAESMKLPTTPALSTTAQEILAAIAIAKRKHAGWALWETRAGFSKRRWAVISRPRPRQRPRRSAHGRRATNFHHLTGHYQRLYLVSDIEPAPHITGVSRWLARLSLEPSRPSCALR